MCDAGVAAAQQMMIRPDDLQQLLQASAAAQQPNTDWNTNAELLHQLQQMQQVCTNMIRDLGVVAQAASSAEYFDFTIGNTPFNNSGTVCCT